MSHVPPESPDPSRPAAGDDAPSRSEPTSGDSSSYPTGASSASDSGYPQQGYPEPNAGYGNPPPQQSPPPGYQPGYNPGASYPPQAYGQPPQGYGQPPQAYGQPPQAYGQPPEGPDPMYGGQGYGAPGYGAQGYEPVPPPPGYAPQPGYGPPPSGAGQPLSPSDENTWGILSHISIPFFGFIGPLIAYLLYKDRSEYLKAVSTEALNFSILYSIVMVVGSILTAVVIGAIIIPVAFVGALVLCILATMAASRHEFYKYPVNVRFLK